MHSEQGRRGESLAHLEAALAIHREVGQPPPRGHRAREPGRRPQRNKVESSGASTLRGSAHHRPRSGQPPPQGFLHFCLGVLHHDPRPQRRGRCRVCRPRSRLPVRWVTAASRAIALSKLGVLHGEQQRLFEAGSAYEQALALAREVGYRSLEGAVLGAWPTFSSSRARSARPSICCAWARHCCGKSPTGATRHASVHSGTRRSGCRRTCPRLRNAGGGRVDGHGNGLHARHPNSAASLPRSARPWHDRRHVPDLKVVELMDVRGGGGSPPSAAPARDLLKRGRVSGCRPTPGRMTAPD